jgi:hypothetical protein
MVAIKRSHDASVAPVGTVGDEVERLFQFPPKFQRAPQRGQTPGVRVMGRSRAYDADIEEFRQDLVDFGNTVNSTVALTTL